MTPLYVFVHFENCRTLLADILRELASVVEEEQISTFNICRSRFWDGLRRGMKRKAFSASKRISVVFTDSVGTA